MTTGIRPYARCQSRVDVDCCARAACAVGLAPTADDFFTRQVDAWVGADGGVVDPDGGLDDGYDDALAASWGGEAWDDADVY